MFIVKPHLNPLFYHSILVVLKCIFTVFHGLDKLFLWRELEIDICIHRCTVDNNHTGCKINTLRFIVEFDSLVYCLYLNDCFTLKLLREWKVYGWKGTVENEIEFLIIILDVGLNTE